MGFSVDDVGKRRPLVAQVGNGPAHLVEPVENSRAWPSGARSIERGRSDIAGRRASDA